MEYNINFDSTYFVKLTNLSTGRNPYVMDWIECVVHYNGNGMVKLIPCDDNIECMFTDCNSFEQLIAEERAIENITGDYRIKTIDCYEPLCGGAYLHHSAHYVEKR